MLYHYKITSENVYLTISKICCYFQCSTCGRDAWVDSSSETNEAQKYPTHDWSTLVGAKSKCTKFLSEVLVKRKCELLVNFLYSDNESGRVTLVFELMDMSLYDLIRNRKK